MHELISVDPSAWGTYMAVTVVISLLALIVPGMIAFFTVWSPSRFPGMRGDSDAGVTELPTSTRGIEAEKRRAA